MSLTVIGGLPAHVLFLHAVVVLVPLTALALLACALWPSAASRFGLLLPVLALVTLAFVPLTTHAGEWLEGHVGESELVEEHASRGDGVLSWAIGLAVVSAGVWWLGRRVRGAQDGDRTARHLSLAAVPVRAAAVLVSLVVAAGSVVAVYQAGETGARAAWHDGYSKTARHHEEGDGARDGD